jgi:hypothetical protein
MISVVRSCWPRAFSDCRRCLRAQCLSDRRGIFGRHFQESSSWPLPILKRGNTSPNQEVEFRLDLPSLNRIALMSADFRKWTRLGLLLNPTCLIVLRSLVARCRLIAAYADAPYRLAKRKGDLRLKSRSFASWWNLSI